MMAEMDIECDGFVDLKEFTAFHGADGVTTAGSEKELKEVFWIYDLNCDGLIRPWLLTSSSDHLLKLQ